MNNFSIVRELGRGAAGKVYLAKDKKNGQHFAIKEIKIESKSVLSNALKEIETMKKMSHPYIVRYHSSFQQESSHKLFIVMEYIDGGDLSNFILDRKNRLMNEETILKIFIQIVVAIQFIHSQKIVHRDLKPQNIFLTRVGVVKIGDFGVSKSLDHTNSLCETKVGTPYYLSPEVWNNEPYGSQSDIWSLGCILYELCTLQKPFKATNINQLLVAIFNGGFEPIGNEYSCDLHILINAMLSQDPLKRPNADTILNLPFIKQRLQSMIMENETKLSTVNIVSAKAPKTKKKRLILKKRKIVMITSTTELPLPDKELPRWAQKASRKANSQEVYKFEENENNDEDEEGENEWDELRNSTKVLHSLTTNIGNNKISNDNQQIVELQRTY